MVLKEQNLFEDLEFDKKDIQNKIENYYNYSNMGLFIYCKSFLTEEEIDKANFISEDIKSKLSYINQNISMTDRVKDKFSSSNIGGYYYDVLNAYFLECL